MHDEITTMLPKWIRPRHFEKISGISVDSQKHKMKSGWNLATSKQHKLTSGIEVRANSIRIKFSYRGQWCSETLKRLDVTKAHIKFAEGKLASIKHEIATNAFDYASHFPESKRALVFSGPKATRKTVEVAIDEWLEIKKTKVAHSTYSGYKSKANVHVNPKFGSLLLQDLNFTMIEHWRTSELLSLKNKTINEITEKRVVQ